MSVSIFPEDDRFIQIFKREIEKSGSESHLTHFCFPWQISLARSCLLKSGRNIDEWGGFESAFRKRLVSSTGKIKRAMFNITLIEITPHSMMAIPNRKMLLQYISETGITHDSLGDIFSATDRYFLAVDSNHRDMKIENTVTNTDVEIPTELLPADKKDISSTVASLRLDSICSAAFKLSRGKLKGLIENGGAMIDYQFTTKAGKDLQDGSIISLRGFPRITLLDSSQVTRKGRHRVRIAFID